MIPAAIALFALSTGLLLLAFRRAPIRDDLDDDPAPIPAVEPWRRPIDTQLSAVLAIAREGRH